MSSLVTAAWVKARFPNWEAMLTITDSSLTPDELLDNCIESASAKFSAYTGVSDTADMTDHYKDIVLVIVKYKAFELRHGDTEFEHKPRIVKDYEDIIKKLEKGLITGGNITLTAKDRKFDDNWFSDTDELWFE